MVILTAIELVAIKKVNRLSGPSKVNRFGGYYKHRKTKGHTMIAIILNIKHNVNVQSSL